MGKSADATNGYKSDTRKKREILRNACGELEREPNIDAGKRIARKELFASFCEEYIADYITKLPLDGQYQPLSSIEECLTALPPCRWKTPQSVQL